MARRKKELRPLPRMLRIVIIGATGAAVGLALTLWDVQRSDKGNESIHQTSAVIAKPGQAMSAIASRAGKLKNKIPLAIQRNSGQKEDLTASAQVLPPVDCFDATRLTKNRACKDSTMRGQSSINWRFQSKVAKLMRQRPVVAASFVAVDIDSGEVIALVSHETRKGKASVESLSANAPAASIFKIVTAVALVQKGLSAESSVCTHGGRSGIQWANLKDNKKLDQCEPLKIAFAKSRNSAFAKLSDRKLRVADMQRAATSLGFNSLIPFEFPLTRSHVEVPGHRLKRARMAAGFAAVSLNPIHAALMVATIARGGTFPMPTLFKNAGKNQKGERVMSSRVAREVQKMMAATVTNGTGVRTLGKAKLSSGAKSGTLSAFRDGKKRHNTWMVGYFPRHNPKIAFATLVVNDDIWHIRAPDLARSALDAYAILNRP